MGSFVPHPRSVGKSRARAIIFSVVLVVISISLVGLQEKRMLSKSKGIRVVSGPSRRIPGMVHLH
jgi:hypothetical protein